MDYEKLYKEALERASKYYNANTNKGYREIFEDVFHEFKESEDERIRKGLIKGLSAMRDIHKHQTFSDDAISIDDAIAWLEKQGEHSHCNGEVNDEALQKQLQIWFDKGKCSGRDEVIFHPENFGLQKQGEQKPTWSEEDESMFLMCSDAIAAACAAAYYTTEEMNKMQNWLKSIKPNHWKPSEEQMETLKFAANDYVMGETKKES